MKASELNEVRLLKMKLCAYEILLARARNALSNMASMATAYPSSGTLKSRVEELTLKVMHLTEQIARLRADMEEAALGLATRICQIFIDETEQTLMLLRYVECLPWAKVAERMYYSRRNVCRLHDAIITRIDAH